MATTTRSRGSKSTQATQEEATQEVATTQEATPQVPQDTTPSTQEEATPQGLPKVTGGWDALAYWVVLILMAQDPSLEEKGVTTKQVASYISTLTTKGFKPLASLVPQGTTLEAIKTTPQQGQGGWVRILENSLWRCCPSTPGNKQAGGGKYPQAKLLVRNMNRRPVTFTLDK